jgi:magnesium transporter
VVWLLALIVAATLTVNVLNAFQTTLDKVVALALFIPLVIGTGGNTGSQAATTVTRALAVGEVRFDDLRTVILREARVGLLLGAMLGLLALGPTWIFVGRDIALVVSLTLLVVCTLAAFVGSLLPLVARRVGLDPAVMSAPFISTLVDATGLIVYFLIAQSILGL